MQNRGVVPFPVLVAFRPSCWPAPWLVLTREEGTTKLRSPSRPGGEGSSDVPCGLSQRPVTSSWAGCATSELGERGCRNPSKRKELSQNWFPEWKFSFIVHATCSQRRWARKKICPHPRLGTARGVSEPGVFYRLSMPGCFRIIRANHIWLAALSAAHRGLTCGSQNPRTPPRIARHRGQG